MHATKRRPQLRLGWQSAFAHRLASMPPTPGAYRVVLPSRGRQTLRLPRRPRSLQWRGRVEAQRDNEVLRCSPTSGAVQAAAARVVQRRTASFVRLGGWRPVRLRHGARGGVYPGRPGFLCKPTM